MKRVLVFLLFCVFENSFAQEVNSYPFDFTDIAKEIKEEHTTTSSNLSLLFDNNEHTIYKLEGVSLTRIAITLEHPISLAGYTLAVPQGKTTDEWLVEYSLSGRVWYPVTVSEKSTQGVLEIYTSANTVKSKYYRLTAKGTSNIEIGEWQIMGIPHIDDKQQFPQDITDEKTLIIPSSIGFDPVRNNIPHEQTYIFSVGIDIHKNAKKIVLPSNSNILTFSATLAKDDVNTIYPATELIDTSLNEEKK